MATLGRRIGLGLAARGDIDDVVRWARGARRRAWTRSGSTTRTSSATRSASDRDCERSRAGRRDDGFRVALGAVNPFTRHPVVLAMTGSALDEIAARPDRDGHRAPGCRCASSRWASPTSRRRRSRACRRRSTRSARSGRASACRRRRPACRRSSRCSRRPTGSRSTSRRTASEFVELAGQKADGYLARPAESIPSLRGILERLRGRGRDAGRDPKAIETRGLSPLARRRDPPRGAQPREARAVRDLHDVGAGRRLARAGRLRARPARPDRRRLARRGLPRPRAS